MTILKEFDKKFDQYYSKNEVGFVSDFTGKSYEDIKQFITQKIEELEKACVKPKYEENGTGGTRAVNIDIDRGYEEKRQDIIKVFKNL